MAPAVINLVGGHVLNELRAGNPLLQLPYWDAEVDAELEPESPLGAASEFFTAVSTAAGSMPLMRTATAAIRSST
ncbi:hypothetical protein, partial [Bacillus sp. SIMBA_033]|uniref:hypothetical protein n=1 Tax=Bacillus sp. SIMBA_033 TaxID=3085776 RepID=UPI00397A691C